MSHYYCTMPSFALRAEIVRNRILILEEFISHPSERAWGALRKIFRKTLYADKGNHCDGLTPKNSQSCRICPFCASRLKEMGCPCFVGDMEPPLSERLLLSIEILAKLKVWLNTGGEENESG